MYADSLEASNDSILSERSIFLFWGYEEAFFWLFRLLLFLFRNDWFDMQFSSMQFPFIFGGFLSFYDEAFLSIFSTQKRTE